MPLHFSVVFVGEDVGENRLFVVLFDFVIYLPHAFGFWLWIVPFAGCVGFLGGFPCFFFFDLGFCIAIVSFNPPVRLPPQYPLFFLFRLLVFQAFYRSF